MSYQVTCPTCRSRLGVEAAHFGGHLRCPHCQNTFLVGQLAPGGLAPGQPFSFPCSLCRSQLEAYSGQVGQPGQCPTCGAEFRVPNPDQTAGRDGGTEPESEYAQPVHAYAAAGGKAPDIVRQPDGEQAIKCPRCQMLNAVTRNNCTHCAMPFTLEGAQQEPSCSGFAITSLVLGLVGLPAYKAVIFGIVATVFGGIGMGATAGGRPGRDKAVAGLALGVLELLLAAAYYLL